MEVKINTSVIDVITDGMKNINISAISGVKNLDLSIDNKIITRDNVDYYNGPYSITPASEAQIVNTKELTMRDNVIVEPIPQNYGLITYDGFSIVIS